MNPPAAWHPDPTGRHQQRYWDGEQWTEHVFTDGVQGVDPLPSTGDDSAQATTGDDASGTATPEQHPGGAEPSDTTTDTDTTARATPDEGDLWTPAGEGDDLAPEVEPEDVVGNLEEVTHEDAPSLGEGLSDAFVLSPETRSRLTGAAGSSAVADAPAPEDAAAAEADTSPDTGAATPPDEGAPSDATEEPNEEASGDAPSPAASQPEAGAEDDEDGAEDVEDAVDADQPVPTPSATDAPPDGDGAAPTPETATASAEDVTDAPSEETPPAAAPTVAEDAPDGGEEDSAPMGAIDAPPPSVPPAATTSTTPTGQPPTSAPTSSTTTSPGDVGSLGITGELVGGAFAERTDHAPVARQNSRMLRCNIEQGQGVIARQGTMVAYQGQVSFERQGAGGVGRALKRAATGEGLAMMRVEGTGDVFFADGGQHVFLLGLTEGPGISVNGRNVLAFSSSLSWDIERVKGASLLAGGLFNTTLTGSGWVALVADGEPVVLRTDEAATHVDVNALVAWSGGLATRVVNTVSAKSLVGLGSGEAFQMAFEGSGIVIVQPSEGPMGGSAAT